MNPPPLSVRIVGSRPVVVGSAASTLLLGLGSLEVPNMWLFAAMSFGLACAAAKAEPAVRSYQSWKRDWEALGGETARRKRGPDVAIYIGIGLVMLYCASPPSGQSALLALGLLVASVAAIGYGLARLLRKRPRRASAVVDPVAVCIAKPIYAVVTLPQAFAALPEHCHRLAARQS